MSIRLLARDLYGAQLAVERLERALARHRVAVGKNDIAAETQEGAHGIRLPRENGFVHFVGLNLARVGRTQRPFGVSQPLLELFGRKQFTPFDIVGRGDHEHRRRVLLHPGQKESLFPGSIASGVADSKGRDRIIHN